MIYNTIHGSNPTVKTTETSVTVKPGEIKFPQGVDIRPTLKEHFPAMVDYRFSGRDIIVYLKD